MLRNRINNLEKRLKSKDNDNYPETNKTLVKICKSMGVEPKPDLTTKELLSFIRSA